MSMIMLVRGFKLSVSAFDDFLTANGLPPFEMGHQPLPKDDKQIAQLFRHRGIDCEVRVFVPAVTGYNPSHHLLVCCNWIQVLAVKDIESLFEEPVPPAFEQVRTLLGAESEIRKYIVYNDEAWWYTPQEEIERNTAPIECGACDAVFSSWQDRMKHRQDEHGLSEEWNPLPDF